MLGRWKVVGRIRDVSSYKKTATTRKRGLNERILQPTPSTTFTISARAPQAHKPPLVKLSPSSDEQPRSSNKVTVNLRWSFDAPSVELPKITATSSETPFKLFKLRRTTSKPPPLPPSSSAKPAHTSTACLPKLRHHRHCHQQFVTPARALLNSSNYLYFMF